MTSRRALAFGIATAALYMAMILGGFLFMMAKRKNGDVPRHHLYFCIHPESGLALPCMYRKNDPVGV